MKGKTYSKEYSTQQGFCSDLTEKSNALQASTSLIQFGRFFPLLL